MASTKEDDNGYEDCRNIKLSSSSGSRGRIEHRLLFNCPEDNKVENHQGYQGNEVEDENWKCGGDLEKYFCYGVQMFELSLLLNKLGLSLEELASQQPISKRQVQWPDPDVHPSKLAQVHPLDEYLLSWHHLQSHVQGSQQWWSARIVPDYQLHN